MRLRLMTFNIRFDTAQDEAAGNRWHHRKASVVETIQRLAPDVLGVQEALRSQLDDLIGAFPDYQAVGKPREAGEVGEYVPVFFNRRRFDMVDGGDFWLSATPDIEASLGWDAPNPRHCTWVHLAERSSGQPFAVFNTHLDRWGPLARREGAQLIVTRTQIAARVPFAVMGDFNEGEDSPPLRVFAAAGLGDTFRRIHRDDADVGTVHHYEVPARGEKIDFVMCDESWDVVDAGIVRDEAAGRLPSDHFPVFADVRLRGGTQRTAMQEEASVREAVAELDRGEASPR
jgi:endonuclease/exonuclease/phosphatase family metal-dependent hydrolase